MNMSSPGPMHWPIAMPRLAAYSVVTPLAAPTATARTSPSESVSLATTSIITVPALTTLAVSNTASGARDPVMGQSTVNSPVSPGFKVIGSKGYLSASMAKDHELVAAPETW